MIPAYFRHCVVVVAVLGQADFVVCEGAEPITKIEISSSNPLIRRRDYDYAATLVESGGTVQMWWCGSVIGRAGDQILHVKFPEAEGTSPQFAEQLGAKAQPVFSPSLVEGKFDAAHACDPSVVIYQGKYFMYYGGLDVLRKRELKLPNPTAIGVATSEDGIHWTRARDGDPIVTAAASTAGKVNQYGAGQPSVSFVAPYFYMLFTDTTATGADPQNGAGQFVIRSKSPFFDGIEELSGDGFRPYPRGAPSRDFAIVSGFTSELVYLDCCELFAVLTNRPKATDIRFFDRSFHRVDGLITVPGIWVEGPAVVRDALGHVPSRTPSEIAMTIVSPTGEKTKFATWDLLSTTVTAQYGRPTSGAAK